MRSALAVAAVGLAAALVVGEGVARLHGDRICFDVPGAFLAADARFGWAHVPGLRGRAMPCGDGAIPSAPFETNGHGLRDPERPFAKPADTARFLLVGGNLPEGLGVARERSLAGMLEDRADRRRGKRLEVVNAGIGNFALDNALAFLRAEGLRWAPDVVLLVVDPVWDTTGILPTRLRDEGVRVPEKPYLALEGNRLVPAEARARVADQWKTPAAAAGRLGHLQLWRLARGLPRVTGTPIGLLDWPSMLPGYDAGAERQHGYALAGAILAAIDAEVRAAGGRLVVVLAPIQRTMKVRLGALTEDVRLVRIAADLGIPTVNLGPALAGFRRQSGRTGFFAGTTRLDRTGHFVASRVVWDFLATGRLLPAGLVAAQTLEGGRVPALDPFPGELASRVWRARFLAMFRVVAWGLLGAFVLWVGAPLPAVLWPWWLALVSLGVVTAVAGPVIAAIALAIALAVRVAVDVLPRVAGTLLLVAVAFALAVAPVWWTLQEAAEVDLEGRPVLAFASAVGLLRVVAYAADRRRGTPGAPLGRYLAAMLFFPTFAAGPVESPALVARRRHVVGLVAETNGLPAVLRAAPGALVHVGAGVVLTALALFVLNTALADVYATRGRVFSHPRLWLWVLEVPAWLYCTWAGWTEIAVGLGRLAGARVAGNFRAPWRSTDPADFWRRTFASVAGWFGRYVRRPLSRAGAPEELAIALGCVAGALWWTWIGAMLYGPVVLLRWQASAGVLVWAALHAAGLVLARRTGPSRPIAGRALTLAGTTLAWIPFVVPPWLGIADAAGVFLRVMYLR